MCYNSKTTLKCPFVFIFRKHIFKHCFKKMLKTFMNAITKFIKIKSTIHYTYNNISLLYTYIYVFEYWIEFFF